MTEKKKTALTPDEHHELCRHFAKGVASGIPTDPEKLVAVLTECFRAEARPLAEAILELKDLEVVHALTGVLESHTKHASACGCLQACLSATVAHRIDETVRGNETGAARAFLAVVARSFVDIFARTIRQEESGFVQGVTGAYFHKEYAHVLLAVAVTAVDGDAKDPDDNDVN